MDLWSHQKCVRYRRAAFARGEIDHERKLLAIRRRVIDHVARRGLLADLIGTWRPNVRNRNHNPIRNYREARVHKDGELDAVALPYREIRNRPDLERIDRSSIRRW